MSLSLTMPLLCVIYFTGAQVMCKAVVFLKAVCLLSHVSQAYVAIWRRGS